MKTKTMVLRARLMILLSSSFFSVLVYLAGAEASAYQEGSEVVQSCLDICSASFNEPTEQCDCCYESLERGQEGYTARDWWANDVEYELVGEERASWIRTRKQNEPIVGEQTLIAASLYTISKETLKMTALFPPLYPGESRSAELLLTGASSGATKTSTCQIIENAWNCLFRIEDLPQTEDYKYTVSYIPAPGTSPDLVYTYGGSIPIPRDYPTVAALGCFGPDSTKWKRSLVDSVLALQPDIIVLQGDQTYFPAHLGYGHLETFYTLRELTRNIPTIVQLDDHDYGKLLLLPDDKILRFHSLGASERHTHPLSCVFSRTRKESPTCGVLGKAKTIVEPDFPSPHASLTPFSSLRWATCPTLTPLTR